MVIEAQKKGLIVLDPTLEATREESRLAPRLDTLGGKVVGLLDNSKLNADRFLSLLERELRERYRIAGVVRARKPSASRVCPEETVADLASHCDAVITAVGD